MYKQNFQLTINYKVSGSFKPRHFIIYCFGFNPFIILWASSDVKSKFKKYL